MFCSLTQKKIWMPLAASFIHGTREHAQMTLAAYWIQRGRRRSTIPKCLNICPNGGQKGLLTDRLTIKANSWSLTKGSLRWKWREWEKWSTVKSGRRKRIKLRLTGKAFFQKAGSKWIRNVGQRVPQLGGAEGQLTDRLTIKSNSWSLIEGVSAESGENGKNEVQ